MRSLDSLPVRDGFRLRGTDMTRLETFTDAAFAFAVTLLVISVDSVPTNYGEFVAALRGLPTFAASFAILMLFWFGHWQWSRRFGLEDLTSIFLSLALVLTVLSYVYPLKYMFALFTLWVTGAATAGSGGLESADQLDHIFAIYGVGFAAMALLLVALNAHAYRNRDELGLSELERFDTRGEMTSWVLVAATGLVSTLVALLGLGPPGTAGWVYMSMPVTMPAWGIWHERKRSRVLDPDPEADSG